MVRLSLFLCALLFSSLLYAEAIATLDRNVIQENETVTLTLSVDSSKLFGSPEIDALSKDFVINSQQKSSQSQWINGKSTTKTEWIYSLSPKEAGIITIPAIKIGKEKTQALTLQVKRVQNPSGLSTDPIFLEVETDKQSVFVQEQILLTIRINYAIQLSNLSLEPLAIENARLIQGNESQYNRSINGRSYNSYEIKYAIFPQQSGELIIPSITVEALVPRSNMDAMMQRGQRQLFRSQVQTIEVKAASNKQITAESLQLQESWSADPSRLKVGDSITRTITQKAQGLLAEHLPNIELPQHDGIRIYTEQPQFDNQINSQGNSGTRTDSLAIVVTQGGEITLPAIKIAWINSQTGQKEFATLPAITLQVEGEAPPIKQALEPMTSQDTKQVLSDMPTATLTAQPDHKLWLWQLSNALSLLIIILLSWLLWRKQHNKPRQDTAPENNQLDLAMRTLRKAAAGNNTAEIRQALLHWAKLNWAEQAVYSLADIKRLAKNERLSELLDNLDKAIYQKQSNTQNWSEIVELLQHSTKQTQHSIYPTL